MAGTIYSGTYGTTILLTDPNTQQPATLTGSIAVHGTNASSDSGFYSNANFAWSINNFGRITATGNTSYGICLLAGGTIQNGAIGQSGGLIQSDNIGILLTGAAGSVTNDGTIAGTKGRGVFLRAGGSVTNGGVGAADATIVGGFIGVAVYNAGGQVTNAGTISATGSAGLGVELYAGTVSNAAGGRITGTYGVGFVATGATGTLTNAGTIIGAGRDGVAFEDGGTLTNSGSIQGYIAGVLALSGSVDAINSGAISGLYAGVDLVVGGSLTNQSGGHIDGGFGVVIDNGSLTGLSGVVANYGSINATRYDGVALLGGGTLRNRGTISGAGAGMLAYGTASLSNTGSIAGGLVGVELALGGTISNSASGEISGGYGIILQNGAPTGQVVTASHLNNAGRILGTGQAAVEITTNGAFFNAAGGLVQGGRYGVLIASVTGTVINDGVISGGTGVYGRHVVANGSVYPGQLTIQNAGTIIGNNGTAVSLFASNDLLIDRPGAVFIGVVEGGGGRLELTTGGTGALGQGLARGLASFASVSLDGGAVWQISGTLAAGETLTNAGTALIDQGNALTDNGTIAGVGTIALSDGGTLFAAGAIPATQKIEFTDLAGHLALVAPLQDGATSFGFSAGDTIYLPNIAPVGLGKTYVPGTGGGTLDLRQSGSLVAALAFSGSYTAASFALAADPAGGTDVLIPCFLAGTRLLTPAGERAVESLRPGEQVLTATGAARVIVWIGRSVIDGPRRTMDPQAVPIDIRAGAFGRTADGGMLPARDLSLSPDHAVRHGGVLIPVHLLVNGDSIRPRPMAVARYFHVELASHDVLLAEGLAVESYLDTGNRHLLGAIDPAAPPRPLDVAPCLPYALAGEAIARARRHVLACTRLGAGAGVARPEAPIELRLAGVALAPVRRVGSRLHYLLPAGSVSLSLSTAAGARLTGALLDGLVIGARAYGHGFGRPGPAGRSVGAEAALHLPACAERSRSLELILGEAERGLGAELLCAAAGSG